MKTFRFLLVAFSVIGALFYFFIPGGALHVRQSFDDVGSALTGAMPTTHIVRLNEEQIDKVQEALLKNRGVVGQIDHKVEELRAMIANQKASLVREEKIVSRAAELLEKNKQPGGQIIIGQCKFTSEQVSKDVSDRIATCESLKAQISRGLQCCDSLNSMREKAYEAIQAQQRELDNRKAGLKFKAAELASLEMQEETNALITKINGSLVTGPVKDLNAASKMLDDRIDEKRARVNYSNGTGSNQATDSAWEKEMGTPDALAKAKEYLGQKTSDVQKSKAPSIKAGSSSSLTNNR
jgi:hypothetical protein